MHTIDIVIDDWDAFISTATSEEYSLCSVVIDGEAVKNVGIRGKGNTSLSSVSSMGSQRYSFKIEFDQYDSTKSYHGLDKLSLNNVIQDNTYMKDYLTYQMMNAFGVSAPLCSYAYITVNGEDWGLYLAVEGVEDGFLQRNYGYNYGELYKPDSMSFGGGRGNGKEFDISDFTDENGGFSFSFGESSTAPDTGSTNPFGSGSFMPDMGSFGSGSTVPDMSGSNPFGDGSSMPDMGSFGGSTMPNMGSFGGSTMPNMGSTEPSDGSSTEEESTSSSRPSRGESGSSGSERPDMGGFSMGGFSMGGFGMGSSDVKLQYIDDNASSYSNIFNNAKTDITEADQNRLIASLKQLSEYRDLEQVVDIEKVLRYFVVHNYVVNGDSYTGSMIHNYYLYEEDGQLSMIPWDYNLAYGTFSGGNGSSSVNESIDDVLTDRPMQAWIFSDEAYTEQYYALYAEMLQTVDPQAIIDHAYALIAPYVAKDPTAFCSYEEFEKGVAAIKSFCAFRSESVALQLSGSDETVTAEGLNISDMGTMGGGFGGGNKDSFGSDRGTGTERSEGSTPSDGSMTPPSDGSMTPPSDGSMPATPSGFSGTEMGGIVPTSSYTGKGTSAATDSGSGQATMPSGNGQMPDMGDFSSGNMPDMGDFDPSTMPDMGDFDMSNMPNMGDFDMSNIPQGGMQSSGNSSGGQRPGGSQSGNVGNGFAQSSGVTMLIASVAVLAAGLLFAALFKRRK